MQEITDTTNGRLLAGLAIAGHQFIQAPFDGREASIDRGQPGREGINGRGCRLTSIGRGVAAQDGVEVLGVHPSASDSASSVRVLRRRWAVLRCSSRTIATDT
jgi:hypothetical protein